MRGNTGGRRKKRRREEEKKDEIGEWRSRKWRVFIEDISPEVYAVATRNSF